MIIMKKIFLGINIILLWITLWHFYRFPITENMSLSLYNKKVYRRLIPNTIDPIVKSSDLLFNINFGGEEQDDAGRAYVKGLMKNGDIWIGYVYSFDEIMEESPAYASNPPNGNGLVVKEYVNRHSGYFYVTSNETKYHLTKEELPQSKLKDEKDIKAAKNIEETIKKRRIFWLLSLVLCLILQILFLVKNKKEMVHND